MGQGRQVNLKFHTGRMLAVCTITGFLMGSGIVLGHRSVDKSAHELGSHSLALHEVDNLEAALKNYVFVADLVLQKEVTSLLILKSHSHFDTEALTTEAP